MLGILGDTRLNWHCNNRNFTTQKNGRRYIVLAEDNEILLHCYVTSYHEFTVNWHFSIRCPSHISRIWKYIFYDSFLFIYTYILENYERNNFNSISHINRTFANFYIIHNPLGYNELFISAETHSCDGAFARSTISDVKILYQ